MSSRKRNNVTTHSEAETRGFARDLAFRLNAGDIVLLYGDLGAGKTAFVKGLAEGLGIDADEVTSPTFTLVHQYRGERLPLVHVDLYRLDRAELEDIGLDPDIANDGVMAIEWAERLVRIPPGSVRVHIADGGGDRRSLTVTTDDGSTPSGNSALPS